MKKLSLKNLKFGANDPLKREELKTIFGGYSGGGGGGGGGGVSCTADCIDRYGVESTVTCDGNSTCVATDYWNVVCDQSETTWCPW